MGDIPEADRRGGAPHPRETSVLFGQAEVEARFLAALSTGRLPHGWLLTGPEGVGKATLAWRIARCLIAGGAAESLQMAPEAPAFRTLAGLASPRLYLARRPWDDKAKRLRTAIGIEEVRGLKAFFQLSAADGGARVAIVDAADDLTPPAANALLKILEEPPAGAVLLLVAHQPARLLPTIRSRCRALRLRPLAAEDLARAMAAAGAEPPDAATAVLAGGSVGAALDLEAGGGAGLYADLVDLLAEAPGLSRPRAIALAERCAGRDGRDQLLLRLTRLALSRLALAAAGAGGAVAGPAEAALIARLAQTPNQARIWAEAAPVLVGRAEAARAVNLDPAQVILDMLLAIDAVAARAFAAAA